MHLSDEELFDFDHGRLAHFDLHAAEDILRSKGNIYRAQLVPARWIEGWRERVAADDFPSHNGDWQDGWDTALREVTAHLRQGDLIPDGVLHDETDDGRL
jgi:hypothetical protein